MFWLTKYSSTTFASHICIFIVFKDFYLALAKYIYALELKFQLPKPETSQAITQVSLIHYIHACLHASPTCFIVDGGPFLNK